MSLPGWCQGVLVVALGCASAHSPLSAPSRDPNAGASPNSGPSKLTDGGLGFTFDDGRTPVPVFVDGPECEADAGAFLQLLSAGDCQSDVDCKVYRHGLGVGELDTCYAVHADLLKSKELAREFRGLERACGRITAYPTQGCSRARCANHKCKLDPVPEDIKP
jgi:hypothetical protein